MATQIRKKRRAGRQALLTQPANPFAVPVPAYGVDDHFNFEDAAEVSSVDFRAGERALDGCWLTLAVRFTTHHAPEGKKWEIWPQEAALRLRQASGNGGQLLVGAFRAPVGQSIGPSSHAHKSDSREVMFQRLLSATEISAIEEWRDGRDLAIQVNVGGAAKRGTVVTWGYFRQFDIAVPWSRWRETLAQLRHLEKIHLVVAIDGDPRVAKGASYLREAMDHHVRGTYSSVAQACRKALEEIGIAGFGQKAPADIRKFLRDHDQREYTLEERAAVMQVASLLFLHSGAHAGEQERRWSRRDADLALAVTGALLQVAPLRLAGSEPVDSAAATASSSS